MGLSESETSRAARLEELRRKLEGDFLPFVEDAQGGNDASHDVEHVKRVARLVCTMMSADYDADEFFCEGKEEDYVVAIVASLLHDVDDHKYPSEKRPSGGWVKHILANDSKVQADQWRKSACAEARALGRAALEDAPEKTEELFKRHLEKNMDKLDNIHHRIRTIIENISFTKEKSMSEKKMADLLKLEPVLAYVQDADRIDAIGALGVARCFCFGGAKNRALYAEESLESTTNGEKSILKPGVGLSKGEDHSSDSRGGTAAAEPAAKRPKIEPTTNSPGAGAMAAAGEDSLAHFYDKLFTLKARMKTPAGRAMAEERHKFMIQFVEQMKAEIAGAR